MFCAVAVGTTNTSLKPGMLSHGPGTDTACKDGSCDMQSTSCNLDPSAPYQKTCAAALSDLDPVYPLNNCIKKKNNLLPHHEFFIALVLYWDDSLTSWHLETFSHFSVCLSNSQRLEISKFHIALLLNISFNKIFLLTWYTTSVQWRLNFRLN